MSTATGVRQPATTRVKNKTPAPMQITTEQILREATDRQATEYRPPRQRITDPEELDEMRLAKRKEFEDNIRRTRTFIGVYIKYAKWEESQQDLRRARSIFERAIDVDYRNVNLWLQYAEFEMRNKMVNHARNIWDRAVTILPRVDQFWYKYAHMEEMLSNVPAARQIYNRWMAWEPPDNSWLLFIQMELRYREVENARAIYERYVVCHPNAKAWTRYAKFEQKGHEIAKTRAIYERALLALDGEHHEELYISFAKFEESCKETVRARTIYKYALDHIPKQNAGELYKTFMSFEKRQGDREGIEDVIFGKRRFQYEETLRVNPMDYDTWFDYIRLEEQGGDHEKVRQVCERAVANMPPSKTDKRLWRRYIYLWINYAIYEELEAKDIAKAAAVYAGVLALIPHRAFTFAKVWLMAAKFEIRRRDLPRARQLLGQALGMCPKDKLFKGYIEIELALGEVDRVRRLYEKFLEFNPANCQTWIKYAELERSLGEIDRARPLFELAVNQPQLDMPELLWKAYIDFEIGEKAVDNARELYEKLLTRTKHVKVWISYAQFEASQPEPGVLTRAVFERADQHLKGTESKQERVTLVENWKEFEARLGDDASRAYVQGKVPRPIKKKRTVTLEGEGELQEEYIDYIFPDEEAAQPNLRILDMAHKWKKQKMMEGRGE